MDYCYLAGGHAKLRKIPQAVCIRSAGFHPAKQDFICRRQISFSVLRRENEDTYRLWRCLLYLPFPHLRKWISSQSDFIHLKMDFILRSRISLSVLRRENRDAYRLWRELTSFLVLTISFAKIFVYISECYRRKSSFPLQKTKNEIRPWRMKSEQARMKSLRDEIHPLGG